MPSRLLLVASQPVVLQLLPTKLVLTDIQQEPKSLALEDS